jgi:hypothetical protein
VLTYVDDDERVVSFRFDSDATTFADAPLPSASADGMTTLTLTLLRGTASSRANDRHLGGVRVVSETALAVLERGGRLPTHLHEGLDVVTVRQRHGEPEELLYRRTLERIRAIEETGGTVRRAILSCNEDASSGALEHRALIARALLASVLRAQQGKLLLVAGDRPQSPMRRAIFALADTLTAALSGTSACVTAVFVALRRPAHPTALELVEEQQRDLPEEDDDEPTVHVECLHRRHRAEVGDTRDPRNDGGVGDAV